MHAMFCGQNHQKNWQISSGQVCIGYDGLRKELLKPPAKGADIPKGLYPRKRTFAPRNYSSVRVALKCEIAAINNTSVVIAETKQ